MLIVDVFCVCSDNPEIVIPKVLCGNKCDKVDERQVDKERGRELAESLEIPFFETSARTGVGLHEAFLGLIQILMANGTAKKEDDNGVTLDSDRSGKAKHGCCLSK